jgi:hypothetical protein
VRFHDGRHTALTRLAEAGQPGWVIQAQLGHVSPSMMKTYSHVRRKALDAAAAVLEPVVISAESTETETETDVSSPEEVTSHVTSQSAEPTAEEAEILKEVGSSGRIRTYNPPVNSRNKKR